MKPKRKRLWLLVGSLAALGVAATLVLTALNDNIVFFYSPTQVAEKKPTPERRFRLGGLVEQGSVKKSADGQVISFKVTDLQRSLDVTYRGQLPDLFREGQGVIAEGTLGANGVFVAREVLAKHDENYMPPEVAKALKESGRWNEGSGKKWIPELGHFALILALAVALVQGILPLVGASRGDGRLMALGRTAALTQAFLVILAFGALTQAYVTSDFSVANVVANSHSAKPLMYKISGVWGNHEGSMLLWALILALFGAAVAIFGANLPDSLRARVLAVQAWIGVGFLAFLLFTSNPFERVSPAPLDGNGLNPLLQDPGLAFHPPLLYLGYVGFSVTYAFAIAALLEGRVDVAWARWVRPWTLAAWCFLTLGIALGSWWAYYILGWGGFWFWDPVENASLMPWLAGTALLHSAIVVEKRDALKSWTVLLAILAFSLSLLGTFLVRSGVLTSVHAFAQDPARGMFILAFLLLVTGGGLALYAWRAPQIQGGGLFQAVSREGALILNNLLLCTLAATVLLGTLYPLFLDLITGNKVSVGPPFFNATFVPICAPLFAALCVGPFLGWKRAELWPALVRLRVAFIVSVMAAIVAAVAVDGRATLAAVAFGFGVWLILGSATEFIGRARRGRLRSMTRASIGMSIAHASLGVIVLGAVATAAWHLEFIQTMKPGEKASFAGFEVTLKSVDAVQGPNYIAERATLAVSSGGKPYTTMTPERRLFLVQKRQVAETSIHTNGLSDFYVTLGEGDAATGWVIRMYYNPLAPWIWLGAAMCALGGFVSLSDRRLRIGAPKRSRTLTQPAE